MPEQSLLKPIRFLRIKTNHCHTFLLLVAFAFFSGKAGNEAEAFQFYSHPFILEPSLSFCRQGGAALEAVWGSPGQVSAGWADPKGSSRAAGRFWQGREIPGVLGKVKTWPVTFFRLVISHMQLTLGVSSVPGKCRAPCC